MSEQDEHTLKLMNNVMDYANSLGLEGMIMFSERCPNCDQLHGFHVVSSIQHGAERELLLWAADMVCEVTPELVGRPKAAAQQ